MRAAVLYNTGEPLVLEEIQIDAPKANEVKVKIAVAGVCRSDLHFMKGEAIIKKPAVLGHEGSAVVIFVIMALVLLVKPAGLFGRAA